MSAAFPESIERAEEVLRHSREALARADSHTGGSFGSRDDERGGKLTTEVREPFFRKACLLWCLSNILSR